MSKIQQALFWVPNFITTLNLVAGTLAVFFGIDGQLGWAAVFILLATVFDFLVGFSARLLKAYSSLGKELDSLADLISFGLAPAAMLFTLLEYALFGTNQPIHEIEATPQQWMVLFSAVLIPVAGAFRLARFNIDDRQSESFLGLPIPANAFFIASLGLIIELGGNAGVNSVIINRHVLLACIFILSFLMVSELPMFSLKFKSLRWEGNSHRFIFLAGTVILAFSLKLFALPLIILWYILMSVAGILFPEKKA